MQQNLADHFLCFFFSSMSTLDTVSSGMSCCYRNCCTSDSQTLAHLKTILKQIGHSFSVILVSHTNFQAFSCGLSNDGGITHSFKQQ